MIDDAKKRIYYWEQDLYSAIADALSDALSKEDVGTLRGIQMLENTDWTWARLPESVIIFFWAQRERGFEEITIEEIDKNYRELSDYEGFLGFLADYDFITVSEDGQNLGLNSRWDWLFDRPDRLEIVNPSIFGKVLCFAYHNCGKRAIVPIVHLVESAWKGKLTMEEAMNIYRAAEKSYPFSEKRFRDWLGSLLAKGGFSPVITDFKHLTFKKEVSDAVARVRDLQRTRFNRRER